MPELDDILSGKEPEAPVERLRDEETGRFVSANPEPPAPPAEPSAPEPTPEPVQAAEPTPPPAPEPAPVVDHVPLASLQDERRKRQQYERELADLREQMARQAQPVPPPPKDVWEDPAAYIAAQTEQVRTETLRQAQEMMRHQLANLSEQNARQRYTDYDAKRASLEARLGTDPVLRSELNRHVESGGDLGEFVYKTASRLDEVQQYGNIEALVAKRVADELAKLKPAAPVVPQSLNATPSPASNAETWSGPSPLEEIFKRKR